MNLFFISLIINLFFSLNFDLSYPRVLKIFFIIFFVLSFKHIIDLHKTYENKIYKYWFIILLIFIIDILTN